MGTEIIIETAESRSSDSRIRERISAAIRYE
jgi:hypothetical protein